MFNLEHKLIDPSQKRVGLPVWTSEQNDGDADHVRDRDLGRIRRIGREHKL